MKKMKCAGYLLLLFMFGCREAVQAKNDYETIVVGKRIGEFPEKYSKESPLDAFVAVSYITANGKEGMWRSYSTYRIRYLMAGENVPDRPMTGRDTYLNRQVVECIVYRDSTAAVLTVGSRDSSCLMRYLSKEGGRWLNVGEGMASGLTGARKAAVDKLPRMASLIPRTEQVEKAPTDTVRFVNYVKTHGQPPHRYILEKLAKHKIVVYGEHHRRKVSWNLLRQVIREPEFARTTGTVFFELPSHKQADLDRFYAQEHPDTDILLDIFGCEQVYGWHDKDEFDFMVALWHLNRELPEDRKIKVVLADYQMPWDRMKSADDVKAFPDKDRNRHMADVVEQTMKANTDGRHALFIVGYMHALKSNRLRGLYASASEDLAAALPAGAQLADRFSAEEVFCIFPHVLPSSNFGKIDGKIRHGIFDYAFEANGNVPVAFDLVTGPFGAEPFDAALEIRFDAAAGNYADNFDGYVFFQALDEEVNGSKLCELITDEFVGEIKRRAALMGWQQAKWLGVPVTDLTPEIILDELRQKDAVGKRWVTND